MDVLNFDVLILFMCKGEIVCDMLKNLEVMGVCGFVVCYFDDGVVVVLVVVVGEGMVLVNVGDGCSVYLI